MITQATRLQEPQDLTIGNGATEADASHVRQRFDGCPVIGRTKAHC